MAFDPAGLNIIFDDDAFIITRARLNEAVPLIVNNVTSILVVSDIDTGITIDDQGDEAEIEASADEEVEVEEDLDEVELYEPEHQEAEIELGEEQDPEVEP